MYYYGHGWIAAVLFLGSIILANQARHDFKARWFGLVIVLAAALLLVVIGRELNRRRPFAHDGKGNLITEKPYHALGWIPIEYWSLITLAAGLCTVFI